MARKHIGRILSGGVMVLCVILWFTPETYGQFRPVVREYTISGNVGLPNVTMQGFPASVQTDENGVYTVQVRHGWSGTVRPIRRGYTFEPSEVVYRDIEEDKTQEHYQATPVTYRISGSTGKPDVRLVGLPDDPITDANGRFSATVHYGWAGVITPVKEGYRFEPPTVPYTEVTENKTANFKAIELTYTISGSAGAEGVVMEGLPGNPRTDRDGNYSVDVPHNWSGTVTPKKEGYTFNPPSLSYTQVVSALPGENYSAEIFTYQISGTAGLPGVTMDGLPGSPVTDHNGYYSVTVPYGWEGEVKPSRPGYTFTPPSKRYTRVTRDYNTENYTAELITLKISGNVRQSNVRMDGLPGNVVSNNNGIYTAEIEWGWAGTVTPMKDGYAFEPAERIYPSLTNDQLNQNYTAQPITYIIAGNVGQPQVRMEGLGRPGQVVVSGPDGAYRAQVDYNWSGKVTPRKTGYTFTPESRTYENVQADRTSEDYNFQINRYTVTGRVLDEQRSGVANVPVYADGTVSGSGMTDGEGRFELIVEHGWQGNVTPQREDYTFNPPNRRVGPVHQNTANVDFVGQIKMMSITDSVMIGDQPLQDVLITATPGNYTATTDSRGRFTIQVPYGWSGGLTAEKRGFDFGDAVIEYSNVTADIDKTVTTPAPSRPVTPPVTPPRETVPPPVTPPTETILPTPPEITLPTPTTDLTPAEVEQQRLREEIEKLHRQMAQLLNGRAEPPNGVPPVRGPEPRPTPMTRVEGPLVSGVFEQRDLRSVLAQLSSDTNVAIAADRTVRPGAMTVNIQLDRTPLESALSAILGNEFAFRKEGDAYLVYRPITQMFLADDLRELVIPAIAEDAGVIIMTDVDVMGTVTANLDGVPLKTALDIVLAGTPFVAVEKEDYYLVGDRAIREPEGIGIRYPDAFPEISETRMVYMNHIRPTRARELMSGAFQRYVMADPDPNSHIVTVTAPRVLADRIVQDLKQIDIAPRQVLLDARVVVMERTDLLNMGIEWGFPQVQAGIFTDSFVEGDRAAGSVTGSWPYGIQVGYRPDRTFTDSLLMALNLLQQNGQADIVSNPQVFAQDGRPSQIRNVVEEHYVLTPPMAAQGFYIQSEFVTITSGTTLNITPRIGDDDMITLEMVVEVSESLPRGQTSDLPMVTRRSTRSHARVADGGTVAVAGLTESRSRTVEKRVPGLSNLPLVGPLFRNTDRDQSTKEVAVFVTAQMVHDRPRETAVPQTTMEQRRPTAPATNDFYEGLRQSLANQNR